MQVGLIGANFKTADLALREKFALALTILQKQNFSFPLVVISTCNRAEVYFSAGDLSHAKREILLFLPSEIAPHLYSYFGLDCFIHLARVCAGLDSAIWMESEIRRQVKLSYLKTKFKSKDLHYLFQKSFRAAKKIRNSFASGASSLERMIWKLSKEMWEGSYLFVGYSKTNRLIHSYLQRKGITNLTFASRTSFKNSIGWDDPSKFFDYDVIIVASAHDEYILKKHHYDLSSKKSSMIFDLSLPRLVDLELSFLKLINIDQLQDKTSKKPDVGAEVVLKEHVTRLYDLFERKGALKELAVL